MTDQETAPPSVGEQLRLARESRKLSLEEAAYQTHIRLRYLTALETDDIEVFPSQAQARGFLRTYANHLSLDAETMIALLDGNPIHPESPPPSSSSSSPTTPLIQPERAEKFSESEEKVSSDSNTSFIVIGQQLRSQREQLGLSIENVERHSHIRAHYLQALEGGNLDDLPSPVQGRGMLTNYANFLGLDPDKLLLHYAEGLQARLSLRQRMLQQAQPTRPRKDIAHRKWRIPLDLLFGSFLILALIAFLVWGAIRISDMTNQTTPEANGPSIAEILAGNRIPTITEISSPGITTTAIVEAPIMATTIETVTSGEASVTEVQTEILPSTPNNAPVQIYIIALERCWMSVTVDDQIQFQGRTLPGSTYPYAGNERIVLKTGNGSALKVIYNQRDLGVLGSFGEVIEQSFTVSGIHLPTATITSSPLPPTSTPLASPTPTETQTP